MTQATYRGSPMEPASSGSAPLITLFERDDAIAVPLLSQLRMAGYDVRAARTPVELFDLLSKSLVALVLVDLGAAAAGRREFWVAMDAQRRGRAMQVMTFRFIPPHGDLDLDMEPSARAIADVEAHGAHEFQRIIDGVRQRVRLHSQHDAPAGYGAHGAPGMVPPGAAFAPNGGIQPLGAALGMAPTPFSAQNGHLFNMPGMSGAAPAPGGWGGIAPLGVSPVAASVFEGGTAGVFPPSQPLPSAGYGGYGAPPPFDPSASRAGIPMAGTPMGGAEASRFASPPPSNPFGPGSSPFAQPYQANPFSSQAPTGRPPVSPAPPMGGPMGAPVSPAAPPWQAYPAPPSSFPPSFPSSFPSSYPSNSSPGYAPSVPSPAPSSGASWGSDASHPHQGQNGWSGPSSLGGYESAPGYGRPALPPYATPPAPSFQDAWSPPDAESDLPTGVVPEIAFQQASAAADHPAWQGARHDVRQGARHAPHDDPSGPLLPPQPDAYIAPRSQLGAEAVGVAPSRALVSTPPEVALGGVLVDGALLTPARLEALKGIQAMLAGVNLHRKLGDLALMFKFLSADQLLAALLVSRGLVSPAQIAYLGRMKKEMAEKGIENDLETLLISFKILPAEQLRKIRAELGG